MINDKIKDWWHDAWSPPKKLNPWQWAEENLVFSERITSMPGPFRTTRTPYMRGILEAFADPNVRKITLCFPAQTGKTTIAKVALAFAIDQQPGPSLYFFPSAAISKEFSANHIQPLLEDSEVLKQHITDRKHDFKLMEMRLDRMSLYMAGAASDTQLAARSIRYLFCDEVDKWKHTSKTESHPLYLAVERVKNFRNHKILIVSTPTLESGAVWQNYNEGTRELYNVSCTNCGLCFPIEQENFKFEYREKIEEVKKNAWIECPGCFQKYDERQKVKLLQNGKWTATNLEAQEEHRSFRLTEFASPVTTWGSLAYKFLQAKEELKKGNPKPLQNYINSSLAEPWIIENHVKVRKDSEISELCDKREPGEMPDGTVLAITAGVDTQDDGFWYVIRAWGEGMTSWLLEEGYLHDTEALQYYFTNKVFDGKNGLAYPVRAVFIDSGGHRTSEIYNLCRKNSLFRPIKGERRVHGMPFRATTVDSYIAKNGKQIPIAGGIKLYRLDTTYYKDTIDAKMNVGNGEVGRFYLHKNPSTDYFKHMVSERRNEKGIWVKVGSRRCDLWDSEVYAYAAADFLGVARMTESAFIGEAKPKKENRKKDRGENPFLQGTNPFSR